MSGYGVRKVFSTTPMGHFSSSPGSIYPALRRLQQEGLVCRITDRESSKKVFSLTSAGMATLKAWLKQPIDRDGIIWRHDELLLRFSFMDDLITKPDILAFLERFREETDAYITDLLSFREDMSDKMSLHGILALESGIQTYKALSSWAIYAISALGS